MLVCVGEAKLFQPIYTRTHVCRAIYRCKFNQRATDAKCVDTLHMAACYCGYISSFIFIMLTIAKHRINPGKLLCLLNICNASFPSSFSSLAKAFNQLPSPNCTSHASCPFLPPLPPSLRLLDCLFPVCFLSSHHRPTGMISSIHYKIPDCLVSYPSAVCPLFPSFISCYKFVICH